MILSSTEQVSDLKSVYMSATIPHMNDIEDDLEPEEESEPESESISDMLKRAEALQRRARAASKAGVYIRINPLWYR